MKSRERFWTTTAFFLALLFHVILLSPISDWINQLLFSDSQQNSIEIDLDTYILSEESVGFVKPVKRILTEKKVNSKSPQILEKEIVETSGKPLQPTVKQIVSKQAKLIQPYKEAISKRDQKITKQKGGNQLQFTMNTYEWSYDYYIENWASDLQKWWKAPTDYRMGRIPEGGSVWLRIEMDREGNLKGYEVMESEVSNEMELKVIQAVTLSMKRPALPETFPEEILIINWRFVYPPFDRRK